LLKSIFRPVFSEEGHRLFSAVCYAFFGGFVTSVMTAPNKHATPAMMKGVIHTEGSPLPLAASLKYPAIWGPMTPAMPYETKTKP
jgi:hypothetical protein